MAENSALLQESSDNSHGFANQSTESVTYNRYGFSGVQRSTSTSLFGQTKTWTGLCKTERWFLIISFINIFVTVGFTAYRLYVVVKEEPESPDFTFTILIFVNSAFVAFYALHGVSRERNYELYVQVVAIIILMGYCSVEWGVHKQSRTNVKLARLIVGIIASFVNIVLAIIVSIMFGPLKFRIAGATKPLQNAYDKAAIFYCWLKFDLQLTVSLLVLVLKKGTDVSTVMIIVLSVGMIYSICWVLLGWFMLRLEWRRWGFWCFAVLGCLKPVYCFVKIYKLCNDGFSSKGEKTIMYCALAAGVLAILTWGVLMRQLIYIYNNFGKGLKDSGRIHCGCCTIEGGNSPRPFTEGGQSYTENPENRLN